MEEEESENSELETESSSENSSESSSSDDYSETEDNERCGRLTEVKRIPMKRNKRGVLIANIKEIKPKDNKTIEFEIGINGYWTRAILDTGSPITILPRKNRKWIKPAQNIPIPADRKFVDLNGNEVKIRKVFNLETKLNGVIDNINWWEVKAKTKPIVGMDNFVKLGLKLTQVG